MTFVEILVFFLLATNSIANAAKAAINGSTQA